MSNTGISLDAIAVFVKVVQSGSFRQAARVLGMPNTTVSANVARLEERLGVTLIQRTTRKLHVTPAGQAYFERCMRGLAEIQTAENEVSSAAPEPRGLLRIAATVSVAHNLLPPIVADYVRRYKKSSIDLMVTNRAVNLLNEGVDVAVRAAEELMDCTLVARRFIPLSGGLWASRAYVAEHGLPASPADLEKHRLLAYAGAGPALTLTDGRERVAIPVRANVTADDQETVRAFAIEGGGIAPLYDFLAVACAREGKLVRVVPDWTWFNGKLAVMYPSQAFVPANVRAFIDLAVDYAATGAARGEEDPTTSEQQKNPLHGSPHAPANPPSFAR
ncbi:MAG: LysR substrate-binding domain-containing protein [Burkholderiales bacterium]